MYTKLETETFAGKTIQAWRDQATKAGLVFFLDLFCRPILHIYEKDSVQNLYSLVVIP